MAELLDKLNIEFTKSRPRHRNDNGLAETRNGAIVRKHLGYGHIPQRFAAPVNTFRQDFLNPYINFHRPRIVIRWASPFDFQAARASFDAASAAATQG